MNIYKQAVVTGLTFPKVIPDATNGHVPPITLATVASLPIYSGEPKDVTLTSLLRFYNDQLSDKDQVRNYVTDAKVSKRHELLELRIQILMDLIEDKTNAERRGQS